MDLDYDLCYINIVVNDDEIFMAKSTIIYVFSY
jgi:hypothetical protein